MGEDILKNAELTLKDVDLLAVAHGPGSFTGVRIGVSMVKGLAWAGDKPCVGVSTLEAMAWHGLAAGGLVCPVMDARRSQVYNALFRIENGRPVRLTEDRPIALEELAARLESLGERAFLVGDGAQLSFDYLSARGIPCAMAPENLRWQDAWGVAMAAMDKTPAGPDELLPVYLRLSQAERERQERLNQQASK
jgi:tRNA threonylcarbamoyladenosine biosynthesis protein TsaB